MDGVKIHHERRVKRVLKGGVSVKYPTVIESATQREIDLGERMIEIGAAGIGMSHSTSVMWNTNQ